MFRKPISSMSLTDEKEQQVAGELLDTIQYNVIHFVDCLREQKNEELAAICLNFLTALLSISIGKLKFIPISIEGSHSLGGAIPVHGILSAKQALNEFLDSKSDLLASLDTISLKFTQNDHIMLQNNFKHIEENKNTLMKPPLENTGNYLGMTLYPHRSNNIATIILP